MNAPNKEWQMAYRNVSATNNIHPIDIPRLTRMFFICISRWWNVVYGVSSVCSSFSKSRIISNWFSMAARTFTDIFGNVAFKCSSKNFCRAEERYAFSLQLIFVKRLQWILWWTGKKYPDLFVKDPVIRCIIIGVDVWIDFGIVKCWLESPHCNPWCMQFCQLLTHE